MVFLVGSKVMNDTDWYNRSDTGQLIKKSMVMKRVVESRKAVVVYNEELNC